MADLKISALTGASTPLAGTEVLPIVQSGSTVKVSVANLTAGRAVATAGGSFTDNITQSTAARGINFTANTPAAGMTSQLLNWYEEGTWTPIVQFNGGSTGITYSTQSGTYTRIGRQVTLNFDVRLSKKGSSTGAWEIGGFPFTAGAEGSGKLHYQTGGAGINQLAQIRIISGNTYGTLNYASAGSTNQYVDTDATNTSICIGQMIYFV